MGQPLLASWLALITAEAAIHLAKSFPMYRGWFVSFGMFALVEALFFYVRS